MALYDDSTGLESFLQQTTHVSQRLATCQPPVTTPQSASVAACSPVPEPMQVDSTRLSRTERNRRIALGLCLYCGHQGHLIRNCPVQPPRPVVNTIQSDVETAHFTLLPVVLPTAEHLLSVSALVDSGSSCNLIAQEMSKPTSTVTPSFSRICLSSWDAGGYRNISPNSTGIPVTSPAGVIPAMNNAFPTSQDHHPFRFICYLPRLKVPNLSSLQKSWRSIWLSRMYSVNKQPPIFHHIGHGTAPLNCCLKLNYLREKYILCPSRSARRQTIITNHKNLQYLREARRLNPRQARWALFLTRFNFIITYRPGSKNVTADALSRQFSPEAPSEPEPIIPSNLIVSPIIWDLDREIQQATLQEPAPPDCPEGRTYVPRSERQTLLGPAHNSPGSGHPGSRRSLSLLQSRYWWPNMHRDTIRYIQSCSVCAKSNSPRQLPTGKLVPLPIPQRPWSHLGVDFIPDLPNSEGNTCVLVIVDNFSKSCKLVPLRGLPTAMETAEQLFHQVFQHFGLPEEIVSDRGPQFISHVWKAFFKLLGVSVNLSSSYHPQTNGQTERKIQELGRYLRAYCHDDQHSWSRFLPWAEYAQNSLRPRPNTFPVRTRVSASAVTL
ncbi:Transposon Tf2-9 polyprotein [Labeo rohita]|uniref:Gypsy retrotransposon integrase-like protein 1 n=1 Tax=Labeo rohita TaxID=84645 RepID=A0ABQ8L7M4_LABRO|nr:Transposon Tf2-9 polyprotein [Labeo rohita]